MVYIERIIDFVNKYNLTRLMFTGATRINFFLGGVEGARTNAMRVYFAYGMCNIDNI